MEKGISRRREDVKSDPTPSRRKARIQEGIASSNPSEVSAKGKIRGNDRKRSPMITTSVRLHEDQAELLKEAAKRHTQKVADEFRDALVTHFRYLIETDEVIREAADGIIQRRTVKIQRETKEELGF
jgi:hypothetical protein